MKAWEGFFCGLMVILACVLAAKIAPHVHIGNHEKGLNNRCNCKHCDCVNCACGKGERR
jgi:hypothetical protein